MKKTFAFDPMDFSVMRLEKVTGIRHMWTGDHSIGWEFYTKECPYVSFVVDEEAAAFVITVRTSDEGNPVCAEFKEIETAVAVYAFTFASWLQLRDELRKTFAF